MEKRAIGAKTGGDVVLDTMSGNERTGKFADGDRRAGEPGKLAGHQGRRDAVTFSTSLSMLVPSASRDH